MPIIRHRDDVMRTTSDAGAAEIAVAAPGRANLIGEHTDYNDGFVLPVALDLWTRLRGRPAERIRLTSGGHPGTAEVDPATGDGPIEGWGRYVTAVVRTLADEGLALRGVDGRITSDVPVGTGLSSSAALEVAVALAVLAEPVDAVSLARLCQRAENEHVGVRSGIMDQLVSAAASADAALFIDCRSLETAHVRVPPGLRILVVDSGERRQLSRGDYNLRRGECEEAVRRLGIASLRDLTVDDLPGIDLGEPLRSRVRHVVTENARVLATRDALTRGDLDRIGQLFEASHASLAGDYAVSTPRLDALVAAATATEGILAARMTGAGFGGCIVALADAAVVERAARTVIERYRAGTGHDARAWISAPASGAFEASGRAG